MSSRSNIGDRTRQRLTDFLQRLPATHARTLAQSVEAARSAGDTHLPHNLILDALKPVLETAPPEDGERAGTSPEEWFARPFKDLVVNHRPPGCPGRIARGAVGPVWAWLSGKRRPDFSGGPAVADFHAICAAELRSALADEEECRTLSEQLGNAGDLEDVRHMASILEIAADALELQERFARPRATTASVDLNWLVPIFDDFAERHPGRIAPFFFVLAARMDKPWDVLRVMAHLSGHVHSGRPDGDDTNLVKELLFRDLEARAEFFRRLNTGSFDPSQVAQGLRSFTRMVNGLSRAAGISADGRWGRRMMTSRSLVAEKMEILMERAPRDILAVLPVHKIGRFGRVRRRPDLGAAPDPARAERALRMATLLDACRPYAADAAFKVAFSEAAADVRDGLHEYAQALIDELSRQGAEPDSPAMAYLELVIRLTALAVGPEESGRLRRDAPALRPTDLPDTAVS